MTLNVYTDSRLGCIPRHYLAGEEDFMFIPNIIRECVVFLLYVDKTSQKETFAGTAFFVEVREDSFQFVYLITAKHVVVGISKKSIDNKVIIRMNDGQGGSKRIETNVSEWSDHPTDSSVDVSIL